MTKFIILFFYSCINCVLSDPSSLVDFKNTKLNNVNLLQNKFLCDSQLPLINDLPIIPDKEKCYKTALEISQLSCPACTLSLNRFALLPKELEPSTLGYIPHDKSSKQKRSLSDKFAVSVAESQDLFRPKRQACKEFVVDLRNKKCLPPIEDQGLCASCYAFATKAAIEYEHCCRTKTKPMSLSAQQFVDCSRRPEKPDLSNLGCKGGHYDECCIYLNKIKGCNLASDYPYKHKEEKCKHNRNKDVMKGYKYKIKYIKTEKEIEKAIDNNYIVLAAIKVNTCCRYYGKGILSGKKCCSCPPEGPDHAVVIVGYGYDCKVKKRYYIVRNTWGSNYGESGYLRIEAGINCLCCNADLAYIEISS